MRHPSVAVRAARRDQGKGGREALDNNIPLMLIISRILSYWCPKTCKMVSKRSAKGQGKVDRSKIQGCCRWNELLNFGFGKWKPEREPAGQVGEI
jgi:hypothetical protein